MFPTTAPALPAPDLYALLQQRAQAAPDAPALRWLDPATGAHSAWRFARWQAVADALAGDFAARGVGPGERVAWLGLSHLKPGGQFGFCNLRFKSGVIFVSRVCHNLS